MNQIAITKLPGFSVPRDYHTMRSMAERLLIGALEPEKADRLGFKDLTASGVAHLLAGLKAFRALMKSTDSTEKERAETKSALRYWLHGYYVETGRIVKSNTTYKHIVSMHFGPGAWIAFELLVSLGMDPESQDFWDRLVESIQPIEQITVGELFASI